MHGSPCKAISPNEAVVFLLFVQEAFLHSPYIQISHYICISQDILHIIACVAALIALSLGKLILWFECEPKQLVYINWVVCSCFLQEQSFGPSVTGTTVQTDCSRLQLGAVQWFTWLIIIGATCGWPYSSHCPQGLPFIEHAGGHTVHIVRRGSRPSNTPVAI